VVDRYLRYEVMRALSGEILNGDGTGEHFLGVTHLSNKLNQAFNTSVLVTTRKAITNMILNGRTIPTAWVFHPTDFEGIDLQTDNELRYYFGGPGAGGGYGFGGAGELTGRVPTLWGIPVRQSEFVSQGTALLGDWTRYIVADREELTLRVSDSNQDFFIRNMLAVLAEVRAAGYAERDQAFETVSLS
jgi:HK97 family phage major capsid protein